MNREHAHELFAWAVALYKGVCRVEGRKYIKPGLHALVHFLSVEGVESDLNVKVVKPKTQALLTKFRHLNQRRRYRLAGEFLASGSVNLEPPERPRPTKKQIMETRVSIPAVRVPPVSINVRIEPTAHEGGRDGGPFGDVLVQLHVARGNRYTVADQLRVLATTIGDTLGDPIESADILVLMRRPK